MTLTPDEFVEAVKTEISKYQSIDMTVAKPFSGLISNQSNERGIVSRAEIISVDDLPYRDDIQTIDALIIGVEYRLTNVADSFDISKQVENPKPEGVSFGSTT